LFLPQQVRKLQSALEDIKIDIGSKRKSAALDGVKKARALINSDGSKMAASCRDSAMGSHLLNQMQGELEPLSVALKDSMDSFQGSEQERSALDAAYAAQRKVVDSLTMLEELMVPADYQTPVPTDYSDLPQLKGRATVEMKLVKADKSTYDVSGSTFPEAKMVMVVDGYTAPVTAGNFVDLVQRGYYTGMKIQRSDGFVVQTGDPDGDAEGYVGPGSKSVGQGKHGERLIPLEIFVKGDKGPIYETTIEDDGRGGQATVLPFSSYGAMGWAREEYDVNSGGSQFFWLLFDSDLTPAGKNVLDGRYPWYACDVLCCAVLCGAGGANGRECDLYRLTMCDRSLTIPLLFPFASATTLLQPNQPASGTSWREPTF
jgi:cyclophilin family peptidyl-prolyl cis-trans isomerase